MQAVRCGAELRARDGAIAVGVGLLEDGVGEQEPPRRRIIAGLACHAGLHHRDKFRLAEAAIAIRVRGIEEAADIPQLL